MINTWYSHYKYTYNKALSLVKGENEKSSTFDWVSSLGKIEGKAPRTNYYSKITLRNLVTPSHVCSSIPWISETPYAIREQASFEVSSNYKTCLTNLKEGKIKFFDMKFKNRL